MAESLPAETMVSPGEATGNSVATLWNEKNRLAAQIEQLVKPFVTKYSLQPENIEIKCHYAGIQIKVAI